MRTLEERFLRSVQVGRSRFSRCCHLISALWFDSYESRSWARRLTQSPQLGFGFCLSSSWNGFDFGFAFCFTEVGSEKRNFFEFMVPSRNRLLCAFVLTDYLPHLKNPATGMDRYMVVEVSRYIDEKKPEITTAIFEHVIAVAKQEVGDTSKLSPTTSPNRVLSEIAC